MPNYYNPNITADATKRRQYADSLLQLSQQPQGTEMVSGYAVPQSALSGLARAVAGGVGAYQSNKADELTQQDMQQKQMLMSAALQKLGNNPEEAAGILAQNPENMGTALKLYSDALSNKTAMAVEDRKYERELMRDERKFDNQKELQRMRQAGGDGGMTVDPDTGEIVQSFSKKPLPKGVLEMQQGLIDDIGLAEGTQASLGKYKSMIDNGELDLGPVDNLVNKARNYANISTPQSRNLASFQASLEKLRNDSLRLNKGVQTEGDAIRAWNEILSNVNDPNVVKQRLDEVAEINKRAATLKGLQLNTLRKEYNKEPIDPSQVAGIYQAQPVANNQQTTTMQPKFLGFE